MQGEVVRPAPVGHPKRFGFYSASGGSHWRITIRGDA